jgi:sterol desaturase/sphingolipid hydroxylase (fatty acid hydroxylase superfamily)
MSSSRTAPELGKVDRGQNLRASPRMFDSALLDRLSRVHPVVPVLIFVPAIALLIALGAARLRPGIVVLLVACGLAFWSFSEYWLHRVVFHFEPDEGLGKRLHWIIHGVHHDHPNDPLRLVMPPSASLPLAALFLLAFRLVLGTPYWLAFGGGFLLGYLIYDMTHYHVHHHKPKTRLGRLLREQHMRHHFQDHTTAFGVSSPVWDHVFRTVPRRRRRRDAAR